MIKASTWKCSTVAVSQLFHVTLASVVKGSTIICDFPGGSQKSWTDRNINVEQFLLVYITHTLSFWSEVVMETSIEGAKEGECLVCGAIGRIGRATRLTTVLYLTRCCVNSHTAGWQDLAGFRRGQKWPWNLSSSAYLQFSRQMRRFCA